MASQDDGNKSERAQGYMEFSSKSFASSTNSDNNKSLEFVSVENSLSTTHDSEVEPHPGSIQHSQAHPPLDRSRLSRSGVPPVCNIPLRNSYRFEGNRAYEYSNSNKKEDSYTASSHGLANNSPYINAYRPIGSSVPKEGNICTECGNIYYNYSIYRSIPATGYLSYDANSYPCSCYESIHSWIVDTGIVPLWMAIKKPLSPLHDAYLKKFYNQNPYLTLVYHYRYKHDSDSDEDEYPIENWLRNRLKRKNTSSRSDDSSNHLNPPLPPQDDSDEPHTRGGLAA
ncbi:hypothetical protein RF11_10148 [Thelohanellus kitauei]|uniref:Uncharacterized protein n=1 Tax=Thelohanellus kitauei TaxID=669202 RepID=A0A0C2MWR0_THEKT|nr:hypothetical protein RF11_10148 [Thelohanellus kitauei]